MFLDPEKEKQLLEELGAPRHSQILASVHDLPQDDASKIFRYSTKFGADRADVAGNLKAYENPINDFGDWDTLIRNSPKTANFLYDPLHMAIVRDKPSVKTLSTLEALASPLTFLKSGTQKVGKSMVDAVRGVVETATSLDQQAQKEAGDSTLYNMAKRFSFLGGITGKEKVKFFEDLSKTDALTPKEFQYQGQKFSILGEEYDTAQLVANIYEGVPQLAGQIAARVLGGPVASGATIGAQLFGGSYDELRKQGVAPERAFTGAAANATVQAALENVALGKILNKIPASSSGRQKARAIFEAASTEAATEFMQQYPDAIAAIWAKNPNMTAQEMQGEFVRQFRQITSEALYSGLVAAPLGGGAGGISVAVQTQLTKAQVKQLEQRQAVIGQSPLLKVSPEVVEQFENANGEPQTVYLDPKALLQTELPDITDKLGLTEEEVQTALDTGAMVEVPTGKYLVVTSEDPAIHQALKDDIAFDDEGQTVRRLSERSKQDVAQVAAEVTRQRSEVSQATNDVVKQWVEAGVPSEVARLGAIALKSHAYKMSDNPAQFLREKAPLIRRVGDVSGAMKQYAGLSAYTADQSQLQAAQEMDSQGADIEAIRQQTGWFKGMDGKWRFEVDNSKAKLIDVKGLETDLTSQISGILSRAKKVKDTTERGHLESQADTLISELSQKKAPLLGNVLDHPALYQAYPWMKDIKVLFGKMKDGDKGGYDPAINTIEINDSLSPEEKKKVLLHEVQHVIQEQENFARGGNPETAGSFENYRRLAGEVEARDTAQRSDLTEEQRKALLPDIREDAIVYFQDTQDPKGAIHWEEGRAIITLFEKSDPSTLIHEMVGHFFVQNLIDQGGQEAAPDWMKKDRKTALEFAGIENWETATEEQRREAHEKLARAAEAYIMEGKSPSMETRSLFKKFAEWLTEIYRDIVNLRVTVTPEIREVFDRLLATEEEIDQLMVTEGYLSRIPEDIYQSLNDRQKAELDDRLEKTKERAEAQVRAHLMLFLTADNKIKVAEEEKIARERITAEVMNQPLYLAEVAVKQSFKKEAKTVARAYIGNTPFVPEGMDTAMGPLETLEAIYASMVQRGLVESKEAQSVKKQIDRMKKGKGPKVKELAPDQQMEFEFLAEAHGFTSGSELAQNLLGYNTSQKTIENRVEDHITAFKEKLGDSIALHKEVQEAMYSDDGALLIATEQEIIEEQLGKVITRENSRRDTKRKQEAAKLSAQEAIARMPLNKAMRLSTWVSAERRAAELKTRALQRGDLEIAREQASTQLFNHYMVTESLNARREFERIDRYIKRQQKAEMSTWGKEDHFVQAAYIMVRLGFVRKDYNPNNRKESLTKWAERMNEVMDSVAIPDWLLLDGGYTDPRTLKIGELQEAENTLRNIKKIAQTENRFVTLFDQLEIEEAINQAEKLLAGTKNVYIPIPEEGKPEQRKGNIRKFLRSAEKFSTIVLRMDGFKDFGFFHKLLYEPIYKQQNELSGIINELKRREQDTTNRLYTKEEQVSLYKPVYYKELGVSVSKRYLLEMASHLGTESNWRVLFGTPPVGLENSSLWVKDKSGRINPNATSEQVITFLSKNMQRRDWEWVQEGLDNINTLWPMANDMHRQMAGFSMKKVEASPLPIDLPDGTEYYLRGGYYPLREDRRARSIAEQRDASRELFTERQFFTPKTFTGYTNERTGASYAIDLNPMNRYKHVQAVAHDIAFRPVITDMRRLITNDRFKGLMERKLGPEGYAAIRDFVAAAATPKTEASSTGQQVLDTVANTMRERMIVATMMFNMKTLVQNFANPFLYGNAVEGFTHKDAFRAFFNRGVFDYWAKGLTNREALQQDREFVFSRSAFMRDKLQTPDFSLTEFQREMQGEESKVVKWGSMLLAETDNLTNIPMWLEAYHKQITAGAAEGEAIRYADTLIDRTTGSGRKIDTAPLLRGNAVTRLFTMFQTFMNTQYNAWAREYGIYMKERDVMRLTAFAASRWWLFATASLLLSGGAPDGDDDKYAQQWAYEILSYPLNLVPIAGSAASTALAYTMGVQSFGYRMVSVESQVEKLTKVFSTARGVIDGKRKPQDLAEGVTSSAAFVVPYPDQFNRWFWNAFDIVFNDMDPETRDLMRRRPRKERD